MKSLILSLLVLGMTGASAADFRHIGDFVIHSRVKISGDDVVSTAIKPLRLSAYTDGVSVRVSTHDSAEEASEYRIYRSDGIGRQQSPGGPLEVVPGVQAVSEKGDILRQIRLTKDTLTITSFPGVSDQIVVTRARAVPAPKAVPAEDEAVAGESSDS